MEGNRPLFPLLAPFHVRNTTTMKTTHKQKHSTKERTARMKTTRKQALLAAALAAALLCTLALANAEAQNAPKMKMTTDIPPSITTPDTVVTRLGTPKFSDGLPDKATVEKVYDNLDFMRGVEAFLNAMPGASLVAMREGLREWA